MFHLPSMPYGAKLTCDWAAVGIAVGAWLEHLPKVAALFTVIWLGLQIYSWVEDRVYRVSRWLKQRRG